PGTRVLRLVRRGPLRVRVRVPERDLGRIAVGKELTVTTQATGDRAFPGKVERIAAEVSRLDRTVAVDGVLDAETPELRPGMYAVVSLVLGELVNATVVPSEAIVERAEADRKQGVFVFDGGKAVFRALVVEGEADGLSAVTGKL